jgi:integrase
MEAKTKLKYIDHFVDHLGRRRYRLRRKGLPKVELPVNADVNSPEFLAAYFAALKGQKVGDAVAAVGACGGSGTVANAVTEFLNSTTFRKDADSTQAMRRPILKSFLKPGVGNLPLRKMDEAYIRRWLETAPTMGVQRTWLLAVKPFFCWATESVHLIDADPCVTIKVKVTEGDGHHTWTNEQIEQYRARHPLGTKARLALELLLAVAARRGDGISLGRQHMKNGWLVYTQQKNRRRKPVTVEIPIPASLAEAVAACPSSPEALTFLTNEWGRPFSAKAFGTWFRKCCNDAGLPQRCVPHGLRKAGSKLLGDSGCTAHEIMAVTGHRTLKEVQRYTEAYDRKAAATRAQAKVAAAKDNNNVVALKVATER